MLYKINCKTGLSLAETSLQSNSYLDINKDLNKFLSYFSYEHYTDIQQNPHDNKCHEIIRLILCVFCAFAVVVQLLILWSLLPSSGSFLYKPLYIFQQSVM